MKKLELLLLITFFIITQTVAQDQRLFRFTVEGMSCSGCANSVQNKLAELKGVERVVVDFDTKTAVVYASGTIDREMIRKMVTDMNFEALFGDEQLAEPLTEEQRKKFDIKTVKGGKRINFKEHLSDQNFTIFDFYADWCGPCKVFSPKLENLLLQHKDVALRKVDVVEWKSELAKQLTKDYQLPSLPFTLIFNSEGKLVGKIEGNDIEAVESVITKK